MKNQPKTNKPAFESVWALTQENAIAFKEIAQIQRENERLWKEKQAENERLWNEQQEKTERNFNNTLLAIDKLNDKYGGLSNNIGQFAEDYFINSFKNGQQNFFGEKFDAVKPNLKGAVTDDEYDILLINGKSVCIIETKFKAHIKHIPKVLTKARTFRLNFPQFQNHYVYLGMASLSFYDLLEEECKNNGIAIIKQVGDNVVIIDDGLKTY